MKRFWFWPTLMVFVAVSASAQVPAMLGAGQKPFRGSISYSGSYSGEVVRGRRSATTRGGSVQITPGGRVRVAPLRVDPGRSGSAQEVQGAISFELEFENNQVKGRYQPNGWLHPGTFRGTVSNGTCTLYDDKTGAPWVGPCSPSGFSGSISNRSANGEEVTIRFQTSTMKVVDFVERDRLAAIEREKREKKEASERLSPAPATVRIPQPDSTGRDRYELLVKCTQVAMVVAATFHDGPRGLEWQSKANVTWQMAVSEGRRIGILEPQVTNEIFGEEGGRSIYDNYKSSTDPNYLRDLDFCLRNRIYD